MPVYKIDGPGGPFTAVVCGGRRNQVPPCATCGRRSTKLCDFPVAKGKTCDAPICDGCATEVGMGIDHCPKHKGMQQPQGTLFEGC
jgi:hypothetical protein